MPWVQNCGFHTKEQIWGLADGKKLVKGLNYIHNRHRLGKETMNSLRMCPIRVYLGQRYTLTTADKDFR